MSVQGGKKAGKFKDIIPFESRSKEVSSIEENDKFKREEGFVSTLANYFTLGYEENIEGKCQRPEYEAITQFWESLRKFLIDSPKEKLESIVMEFLKKLLGESEDLGEKKKVMHSFYEIYCSFKTEKGERFQNINKDFNKKMSSVEKKFSRCHITEVHALQGPCGNVDIESTSLPYTSQQPFTDSKNTSLNDTKSGANEQKEKGAQELKAKMKNFTDEQPSNTKKEQKNDNKEGIIVEQAEHQGENQASATLSKDERSLIRTQTRPNETPLQTSTMKEKKTSKRRKSKRTKTGQTTHGIGQREVQTLRQIAAPLEEPKPFLGQIEAHQATYFKAKKPANRNTSNELIFASEVCETTSIKRAKKRRKSRRKNSLHKGHQLANAVIKKPVIKKELLALLGQLLEEFKKPNEKNNLGCYIPSGEANGRKNKNSRPKIRKVLQSPRESNLVMAALTGDHDGRLGFHIDRENNHRETKAKKLHVSKLRKESASTTVVIREKVGPPSGRENDITSTNKVSKPSEELGSNMLKETDENDKRREAYGLPKPSKKSGSVMVAKNVRSNGKIRSHEEFGKNVKPNQVLKPSKEPNSTTWSEINGTVAKNGFNNDSPLMVLKPSEELGTKMMKESDEINERMGAYGCQTILEGRKKRKYGMKTNEANERISARSENGYDDHDIKPIELPKPSAEKSGSIMVARTVEKNVKPIEVLKPLEKSDVIDVTATGESNKRIMSRNKSVKAISQKIKKPSKEFGPIAVKKTIPPKRAQESTDSEQQRKRLNSAVAQELEKRKLKGKIRQYQEEKLKVQAELSEMKTKYEKSETDKHNLFTQTQMQVEKLREWEEVSIDIEETSEEVEETAYMIKQEFDELSSNLPDEIGQRLGYVQNLIAHLNENIDHLTRRREGLADAREL